jgi:Flp pilus assembly pilin Flp
MRARLRALLRGGLAGSEEGNSLAEYTLLLALLAVVCLASLTTLGQSISSFCNSLAGTL